MKKLMFWLLAALLAAATLPWSLAYAADGDVYYRVERFPERPLDSPFARLARPPAKPGAVVLERQPQNHSAILPSNTVLLGYVGSTSSVSPFSPLTTTGVPGAA